MLSKHFFRTTVAAGIISAAVMPTAANAGVTVYNNLDNNSGGGYPFGYALSQSNSFTSSVTAGLENVYLKLNRVGTAGEGILTVNLLSNNTGNTPGGLLRTLGTLAESALSTTLGTFKFDTFTPITLTGGTRYWVNVTSSAGASSVAYWGIAADGTGIGTINEYNYNLTDGGPFANSDPLAPPYQMQVNVPEPDTFALMGLGLLGLGLAKRRSKLS